MENIITRLGEVFLWNGSIYRLNIADQSRQAINGMLIHNIHHWTLVIRKYNTTLNCHYCTLFLLIIKKRKTFIQ